MYGKIDIERYSSPVFGTGMILAYFHSLEKYWRFIIVLYKCLIGRIIHGSIIFMNLGFISSKSTAFDLTLWKSSPTSIRSRHLKLNFATDGS